MALPPGVIVALLKSIALLEVTLLNRIALSNLFVEVVEENLSPKAAEVRGPPPTCGLIVTSIPPRAELTSAPSALRLTTNPRNGTRVANPVRSAVLSIAPICAPAVVGEARLALA